MKKLGVYMKKYHLGGGGGLKLWAFHPPPPHLFLNGIALMTFIFYYTSREDS